MLIVVLKLQIVKHRIVHQTLAPARWHSWIRAAHLSAHGWPAAHSFEPECKDESDDAGARDRVKARAKMTGLVLESAEQVGKTECAQRYNL